MHGDLDILVTGRSCIMASIYLVTHPCLVTLKQLNVDESDVVTRALFVIPLRSPIQLCLISAICLFVGIFKEQSSNFTAFERNSTECGGTSDAYVHERY